MLRAPYCRGVKIFSAAVVAEKRRRTHSFSLILREREGVREREKTTSEIYPKMR
jgi:hypothetical protein